MIDSIVFEHICEVESTNAVLSSRLDSEKIRVPICLSANKQTLGRGRRGRVWLNTDGALMMSICYPLIGIPGERWPLFSLASALGVHDVLKEYLPNCAIKWPNDIVVDSADGIQKLCGILLELQSDLEGDFYAIIGIGINVNCTEIPEGLLQPATSIRLQTGRVVELEVLKRSVANRVLMRLDEQKRLLNDQIAEYSSCCITLNREVIVTDLKGNVIDEGMAERLLPSGQLVILNGSNEIFIDANDVSIRPKNTKTTGGK